MPYIEGVSVSDQLEIKLKDLEATHDVNRIYKDILGLLSEQKHRKKGQMRSLIRHSRRISARL